MYEFEFLVRGMLGFWRKPSLPSSVLRFSAMDSSLEQTLQDGKLLRHVNALIVAHLRDNNLNQARLFSSLPSLSFCWIAIDPVSCFRWFYSQAATAVASATMTPLNTEAPPSKLLELVAKVCFLIQFPWIFFSIHLFNFWVFGVVGFWGVNRVLQRREMRPQEEFLLVASLILLHGYLQDLARYFLLLVLSISGDYHLLHIL